MVLPRLNALCLVLPTGVLFSRPDIQSSSVPPAGSATAEAEQKPEVAPVPAKAPPTKGFLFKVGDSTIKLGGYIKVDLIHDFGRIGSTDSFDPRTIPTHESQGENTAMSARETRLNLEGHTPTDIGDLKTYIEGDFFGNGNSFRLRHAYGQVDHVLGGQTWSTFMDEGAMPSTLDFESPIAFPLSRVAQVRYTENLENGDYWAVALENPNNSIDAPTGTTGISQNPIPDVTARVHLENERGHVQLGLFGGMASFQPDTGSSDDVGLWGVNLSSKEKTWGDDYALVQLTYGDGIGTFRGGIAAAPDSSGDLEAVRTSAWMAGYLHNWSEKYRSTVTYSSGRGDVPGGAPADSNEVLTYFAANLIWQFCDRAWVGVEYLHGTRETFDDGKGEDDRLQLSMRFDI